MEWLSGIVLEGKVGRLETGKPWWWEGAWRQEQDLLRVLHCQLSYGPIS